MKSSFLLKKGVLFFFLMPSSSDLPSMVSRTIYLILRNVNSQPNEHLIQNAVYPNPPPLSPRPAPEHPAFYKLKALITIVASDCDLVPAVDPLSDKSRLVRPKLRI